MADFTKAGDYEPGALNVHQKKKSATAIARGDVCKLDEGDNTFAPTAAAADQYGPFGVAIKAALAADARVIIGISGTFALTADGAIQPGRYVMASGTTVGQVVQYVPSTISATPTQAEVQRAVAQFRMIVGRYLGKLDEGDGATTPTAAADNDVIRVRLGL